MITGDLFIGFTRVRSHDQFKATGAADGAPLPASFSIAGAAEVARACALADAAFDPFRALLPSERARFLETIAEQILILGDALLERAHLETGLPLARLTGERARTIGQLKLFADEIRDGSYLGVRIDSAMPDRKPAPRSDLRLRKIPLGPVAVFGASNFPLAFSVAGGDTAAALAAGCPVIAKAHAAHPGTAELVAHAILAAVCKCGMPEGVFSLLAGPSNDLGRALVSDPRIKAVGFTGSRAGGLALMAAAAARPEPIPVYAEMSSINPTVLLPGALRARAAKLAEGFIGSMTLGAGQFCTNPGMVLVLSGAEADAFAAAASAAVGAAAGQVMLTPAIHKNYQSGVSRLAQHSRVHARGRGLESGGPHSGRAALFETDADALLADQSLAEEIFGASSLIVRCKDQAQLLAVLEGLEGQLTLSLHLEGADDTAIAQRLIPVMERKAGRLVVNGWPTGVEVSHAMVHGGPYPATSDGRSTSVGTLAIDRFLRPVCYQDFPDSLLPAELRRGQAHPYVHRVDGRFHVPHKSA
ncbi:MAG TPA: aldehyde dehydrogenase (NADP(+)) [Steroidobacteraceae bacterium]|jgi:NADP-dependent aldehyde dehydrogenase